MKKAPACEALCPICGRKNSCGRLGSGSPAESCWCEFVDLPAALLAQIPLAQRDKACICRLCVAEYNKAQAYQPPVGPNDYYLDEANRWVFTEAFHRRRGYCCENNCRHCPYEPTPTGMIA